MSISELKDEYDKEGEFKQYVDKYGKHHGMTDTISVLKCIIVQDYYRYLKDK